MNKMKVMIVAGGKGERLKPFTNSVPKPMVKVGSKPILEHILNLFKKYGFKDFIFCLCYLPEVITNYFGNGSKFGVKIRYTFEEPKNSLGTAGAIALAKQFITNDFILTYADILRDLDIKNMIAFHKKNRAFVTLNIYKRESKNAKSKILIDSNNRVIKFIERPSEKELSESCIWANGSFYILNPEIFNWIPNSKKSDFGTDIFPKLLAARKNLYAYPTTGYFMDIGNLEKLQLADKTFSKV